MVLQALSMAVMFHNSAHVVNKLDYSVMLNLLLRSVHKIWLCEMPNSRGDEFIEFNCGGWCREFGERSFFCINV